MAFAKNRSRQDLNEDEVLRFALVKMVEIIGEAATKLPRSFQDAHPSIPWSEITAMRNRLVHAYFDINLDILWQTIQEDLPLLIPELENLLNREL